MDLVAHVAFTETKFYFNFVGVIIIGAFMITFMFLVAGLAVAEFGAKHYGSVRRTLVAANALNAAEAGGDRFMTEINANAAYKGTNSAPSTATDSCTYASTPVTLTNNATEGRSTYETCVQNGSIANEKIVFSTGKTYLPSTSTTPLVERKIKLVISGSEPTPGYTVHTGPGGLNMSNSAAISNGPVYIGGKLTMTNSSTIGTATKPTEVFIGNKACGSGASYPSTCADGQGSPTSAVVLCCAPYHIYGKVHVVNFPIPAPTAAQNFEQNRTAKAMTLPGLYDNIVPEISTPPDNRAEVLGSANANFPAIKERSAASADCPSGQNTTTWEAGTHFKGGDINVDNKCVVTVTGDVWIDGSLSLSNTAQIKLVDGLTAPANIVIDGQNGFRSSNSSALVPNTGNVGFNITTYWANAVCSPNCTSLTGGELQSTQNTDTIIFSNSFSGSNSVFYARWSAVKVSNGTTVGGLMGQTIKLSNSGTIIFNSQTSSGTSGNWDVKYYEQVYR